MLYLGAVAVAAAEVRRSLVERSRIAKGAQWLAGSILIGLGLRLLVGGVSG